MDKKISIQGQSASYHDIARLKYFGNCEAIISRNTFRGVFKDVSSGRADYGVVAIENSLYGSINQVYDLLLNSDVYIAGEVFLRINHCLIGLPGASLSDIKSIYSQREAIAQCETWIDAILPETEVHDMHDTAGSVEYVKQTNDMSKAAIASEAAAKLHQLEVLEQGIETNKQNYTRFIVIANNKESSPDSDKSSIILTAANKPGSLYEVLGIFNELSINLTKLESRPIPGKPMEYMFYLDFEKAINDPSSIKLLDKLNKAGHETAVLGSYQAANIPKS